MNFSNQVSPHTFSEIMNNSVLAWSLIACGFAQVSKLFIELLFFKRWRPHILIETGGMPSSHSALVTGAASGVGIQLGFDDPIFAIASTLAFIVMYDASGIRRSAGLIAARVNELTFESNSSSSGVPLKETLGHTRLEVFVGGLLGPLIALPGIAFIGSPLDLFHSLGFFTG